MSNKTVLSDVLSNMPDVASEENPPYKTTLDRVGMGNIECPFKIENDKGEWISVTGLASIFVSLDDESKKGIHMSRLYLAAKNQLNDQKVFIR